MPNDPLGKMNADIRGWTSKTTGDLKGKFNKLKIEHRANSPSPQASVGVLANQFGSTQGAISRVGFKFPKHMVFVAKGVGKGVPMAIAGTSATTRQQKDWFNSTIDDNIDELATKVADAQGDLVVNNLHIR